MGRLTGLQAVAAAFALACGGQPSAPIAILDARAPAPVGDGDVMAVYLVIVNHQTAPDTVRTARVDGADAASFAVHRSVMQGAAMRMEPVPTVVVPAGGELRLEPGATHGMVTGLTRRMAPGDTLRLTIDFARAGSVSVAVPVVTYAEITG